MKYIIIAILFLNPILAESQKRKKKNEEVVKETKPSPSVMVECNTVSPVFFMPEGATAENRDESESAYSNLVKLAFNGFPYMVTYQSTVESTELRDKVSKWIAESGTYGLDYDYGMQNQGLIVLRDVLMSNTESIYDEDVFLTEQFGTPKKEKLVVSKDTTEKPDLWYHNNRLYRETTIKVNPEPIDIDASGIPVYTPDNIDDYGNPIYKLHDIYNSAQSEIDFSIIEFLESIQLMSDGKLKRHLKGLSFTVTGPEFMKDFLSPIYINSNSTETGQIYMKDVVSNLLLDYQESGISVYQLERIIIELLKFAKNGVYDIYEGPYEDEMNIAVIEHSTTTGSLSPIPSTELFESDEKGRKFLQTIHLYDSIPPDIGVDALGRPVYAPEYVDAYGNPIILEGKEVHNLAINEIAGIQLLEDWYLDAETGELSKRVKGFTLLVYNLSRDNETIHGLDNELGRRFYFRFKN